MGKHGCKGHKPFWFDGSIGGTYPGNRPQSVKGKLCLGDIEIIPPVFKKHPFVNKGKGYIPAHLPKGDLAIEYPATEVIIENPYHTCVWESFL